MSEPSDRLGLLPEHEKSLEPTTLRRLDALARAEFPMERRSFLARHPEERQYVSALERELKRFLSLPLLVPTPEHPFAPSLRVDELWHDVILNTPRYRALCDEVYGHYLDHQPNQEELVGEHAHNAMQVAEYTNATLTRFYGRLDLGVWGSELTRPCYPPPPSNFLRHTSHGDNG